VFALAPFKIRCREMPVPADVSVSSKILGLIAPTKFHNPCCTTMHSVTTFRAYRVQGLSFFAFAVESYGYLDRQALDFVRHLCVGMGGRIIRIFLYTYNIPSDIRYTDV
jgi:hypothetical protein